MLLKMLLKIMSPILCVLVLFQLTAGSPLSSYDEQMTVKDYYNKILNSPGKIKFALYHCNKEFESYGFQFMVRLSERLQSEKNHKT